MTSSPSLWNPLPTDPLRLLEEWIDRACDALPRANPTAMSLASVTATGTPDARMVICRGFDFERGWLVFYTDLRSAKAQQLEANARAAAIFYWDSLQRQLRIEGPVTRAPDSQSDAYFAGRPAGSQVGAWISDQSQPLTSRDELEARFAARAEALGMSDPERPGDIPRPDFWGGYRIWIESLEFWLGRPDRLHDRARYTRELEAVAGGYRGGDWSRTRLWP